MSIRIANKRSIVLENGKVYFGFINIVLVFLGISLLLKAVSSLRWRMEHDTPLLHYAAFLMDKYHAVPYRDIFETSMPGTFLFHYTIGKLFGYSDLAFRLVDLALLAVLLLVTYLFMLRFGKVSAIWSSAVFGLIYLSLGQTMNLQRDYIGVFPVALALLCIPAKTEARIDMRRFAAVGFLYGLAFLIKPHLAITLPIIFGSLLAVYRQTVKCSIKDLARCILIAVLAFALPIFLVSAWLIVNSAFIPFTNIFLKYLPLHNSLTVGQESNRVYYLLSGTLALGGFGALTFCSILATQQAAARSKHNRVATIWIMCLFLCTVSYAIYPTLAGKFWEYHYMPFMYFCSVSTGLFFATGPAFSDMQGKWNVKKYLITLMFVFIIINQLSPSYFFASTVLDLQGSISHAPKDGRVDEIAGWLENKLRPGDTVQPLDWTGGSIHAMLLAKARLATKFMYDYHFYHSISSPYIQGLRREFMSELREAQPRFIIQVETNKPWVFGVDTTREFPELHRFLNEHYLVAFKGDGYLILEHVTSSQ